MPFEIEESTSYVEAIDSPNHKEWMDAIRDELDSMARNKFGNLLIFLPDGKQLETNGFSK